MAKLAQEPPTAPAPGEAPPSYEQTVAGGAAPPPGGFDQGVYPNLPPLGPPPPHPGTTTTVIHYVAAPNFGTKPLDMVCPSCQSQIRTSTESEPGPMAWVLAGILCVVGFWICSCVPCCIESLNQVTHKCPNCNTFLGRYKGGM